MPHLSREEQLALIERTLQGDENAFLQLREDLDDPLAGLIRQHTDADQATADDLAQSAWVDARERLSEFDPDRGLAFLTFVYGKCALRHVYRFKRDRAREVPYEDDGRGAARGGGIVEVAVAEEALRLRLAAILELHRLTLLCGGYPHEQLAFLFAKPLYGEPSPRGIEGDPERVDEEHGSTPLGDLLDTYGRDIRRECGLCDEALLAKLARDLEPVRQRLLLLAGHLLASAGGSAPRDEEFLGRLVGTTCLREYYAGHVGGYGVAIPDWCARVKRSVRRALGLPHDTPHEEAVGKVGTKAAAGPVTPKGCPRCKLRHVPPCGALEAAGG